MIVCQMNLRVLCECPFELDTGMTVNTALECLTHIALLLGPAASPSNAAGLKVKTEHVRPKVVIPLSSAYYVQP